MMKDYLNTAKWNNRPLFNPTQNMYMRFLKGPQSELKSPFTLSRDNFKSIMERSKTIYDDYLGDLK